MADSQIRAGDRVRLAIPAEHLRHWNGLQGTAKALAGETWTVELDEPFEGLATIYVHASGLQRIKPKPGK